MYRRTSTKSTRYCLKLPQSMLSTCMGTGMRALRRQCGIIHQSLSQQLAPSPAKNAALLRPFVTAWFWSSVPAVMGFNFRLSGSMPQADWNRDLAVVAAVRGCHCILSSMCKPIIQCSACKSKANQQRALSTSQFTHAAIQRTSPQPSKLHR